MNRIRGKENQDGRPFFPSDMIGEFISIELQEGREGESIPKIEECLDIYDQAKRYGVRLEHGQEESIQDKLGKMPELRQRLFKRHFLKDRQLGKNPELFIGMLRKVFSAEGRYWVLARDIGYLASRKTRPYTFCMGVITYGMEGGRLHNRYYRLDRPLLKEEPKDK